MDSKLKEMTIGQSRLAAMRISYLEMKELLHGKDIYDLNDNECEKLIKLIRKNQNFITDNVLEESSKILS